MKYYNMIDKNLRKCVKLEININLVLEKEILLVEHVKFVDGHMVICNVQ